MISCKLKLDSEGETLNSNFLDNKKIETIGRKVAQAPEAPKNNLEIGNSSDLAEITAQKIGLEGDQHYQETPYRGNTCKSNMTSLDQIDNIINS